MEWRKHYTPRHTTVIPSLVVLLRRTAMTASPKLQLEEPEFFFHVRRSDLQLSVSRNGGADLRHSGQLDHIEIIAKDGSIDGALLAWALRTDAEKKIGLFN